MCKAKYKYGIKQAVIYHESRYDDDLWNAYANRRPKEFWKLWGAKYKKNMNANVKFSSCTNNIDVANKFAEKFSSVYCDSSSDEKAVDEFWRVFDSYKSEYINYATPPHGISV